MFFIKLSEILRISNIDEYYSICRFTYPVYQRQCKHINGQGLDFITIFVIIGALLVIALCTRLRITQQGNNVVQYCALVSDATLVCFSDVLVNACSATIRRHRHPTLSVVHL